MPSTSTLFAAVAGLASLASAHMTIWHPSMYGVGEGFSYVNGDPVAPLGPSWQSQDDWWFRGPDWRATPPQDGAVMDLPAGGSVTFEIACHYAWTSYGYATTVPGSALDACPSTTTAGPFHSGDPNSIEIDDNLLSGCALAIADVDNIEDVTMDNLAVFSVNHDCVKQKETSFDIPAAMPPCKGEKCVCGWFWLANNGTANFYMTGFDCNVSGSHVDATPIAPPQDPAYCGDDSSSCVSGSKRPLYAYNSPSNVGWWDNNHRPGYHASWSFPNDGAQNDIFLPAGYNASALVVTPSVNTAGAAAVAPTGAGGAPDLAQSANAKATASSSAAGQGPMAAIDGWALGYTDAETWAYVYEWSSNYQQEGAWLNLVWPQAVTFNQLVLYDRPNLDDQLTSGNITFADGSSVVFGELPNDGLSGLYLNFSAPITTTSLRLTVLGVSSTTSSAGLSEIYVYNVPTSGFTSTVTATGGTPVAVNVTSSASVSTAVSSSTASASAAQNSSSVVISSTVDSSPLPTATSNSTSTAGSSTAASSSAVQTSAVANSTVEASSALPASTANSSSVVPTTAPSSAPVSTAVSSSAVSASSVANTSSAAVSSTANSSALPASTSNATSTAVSSTAALSSVVQTSSAVSSSAAASSALPASTSNSSSAVPTSTASTSSAVSSSIASTSAVATSSTAAVSSTVRSSALPTSTSASTTSSTTSALASSTTSVTTVAASSSKTTTTSAQPTTTSSSIPLSSTSNVAPASSSTTTTVAPTTTTTVAPTSTTTSSSTTTSTKSSSSSPSSSAPSSSSSSASSTTSSTTTTVAPKTTTTLSSTTTAAPRTTTSSSSSSSSVSSSSTTTVAPKSTTTTTVAPKSTSTTTTTTAAAVATATNLAYRSSVTASSASPFSPAFAVKDGDVSTLSIRSWKSTTGAGSWVELKWSQAVSINQVVLYDLMSATTQVLGGNLTFSDGSGVTFAALDNLGAATPINLAKTVSTTSVRVYITQLSATSTVAGLSEVEVFLQPDTSAFTNALTPTTVSVAPVATTTAAAQPTVAAARVVTTAAPSTTSSSSLIKWFVAPLVKTTTTSTTTTTTTQAQATSTGITWFKTTDQSRMILANPKVVSSQKKRHARDFASLVAEQ